MLKTHLTAGIAAAALMTGAALAQTTPAPAGGSSTAPAPTQTQSATMPSGGQFMTLMPANMMRASKLMGVDVYGSDNQKIGDIDEVIVDRDGKINSVVVGIGGFLGIGQKDVAIPYDQVQWISAEEARTAAAATQPATGAGGVTSPTPPASTTAPATTGSTAAPGTAGSGGTTTTTTAASSDGTPARAMVKMSKADLQNAPEFRYSANAATGTGGATGTNPPATTTRPATAPQ